MKILTPAYGRDYNSRRAVLEAFQNGADFILNDMASPWDGKPINITNIPQGELIQFRFSSMRKTFIYPR